MSCVTVNELHINCPENKYMGEVSDHQSRCVVGILRGKVNTDKESLDTLLLKNRITGNNVFSPRSTNIHLG